MQTVKLKIVQPLVHHELVIWKGHWIRFTSGGQSVEYFFLLIYLKKFNKK